MDRCQPAFPFSYHRGSVLEISYRITVRSVSDFRFLTRSMRQIESVFTHDNHTLAARLDHCQHVGGGRNGMTSE